MRNFASTAAQSYDRTGAFFCWRRLFLLEQAFSLVQMFMTALPYSPQRIGNGWFVINLWFNLQD
jgi:hypothetical protein